MIENDVGGGYGARGEFYPEDFLIPFAARHVDRPVKWIEDRRENLMAMNHARETEAHLEIACERDGTIIGIRGEVHTDMGAYMRTNGAVGARNVVQFMGGPYRVPHIKLDSHLWMSNKTPVGTYRGPGRFEFELLYRTSARHGGDRPQDRPRRIAPPQSGDGGRAALSDRVGAADRRQRPVRQRRLSRDVRARAQGVQLGGEIEARWQAGRRQVSRAGDLQFRRRRRRRAEGKRAAGGQRRRNHHRVHGLVGGRAGRRDGVRADRRRCAGDADRAHPPRRSRLDHDGERRLWRVSFALDRDGRLGAARRHREIPGGDPRSRARKSSAAMQTR